MYMTVEVDSTCIKRFTYDQEEETLGIMFRNNSVRYYQMDFQTLLAFLTAESKGRFYNAFIKGKYIA